MKDYDRYYFGYRHIFGDHRGEMGTPPKVDWFKLGGRQRQTVLMTLIQHNSVKKERSWAL